MYLGLVRPLVAEFVEHVNITKGAENAAHEAGLADRFFYAIEAGSDDGFGAYHPSDRACDFAQNIVSSSDSFLPGGDSMSDRLRCF